MPTDHSRRTAGGTPSAVPLCDPHDLTVSVHWGPDAEGGLRGQVVAENTGGQACRLPGKPTVRPVGVDGKPLPVQTLITLEMRLPGYVIVQPGQSAAAPVAWGSWCVRPASDQARPGPGSDTTPQTPQTSGSGRRVVNGFPLSLPILPSSTLAH